MKDFPRYGKRNSESLVRKKMFIAKRSSLKFALTWILMIVVALLFVQQRVSYIRLQKQVQSLVREKDNIKLSILPLKLEERFRTQQDKVEQIAISELGLQVPRQVQIIEVKVNKNNSATDE